MAVGFEVIVIMLLEILAVKEDTAGLSGDISEPSGKLATPVSGKPAETVTPVETAVTLSILFVVIVPVMFCVVLEDDNVTVPVAPSFDVYVPSDATVVFDATPFMTTVSPTLNIPVFVAVIVKVVVFTYPSP